MSTKPAAAQLIVRAIIGLGRSLGMAVNAEGVETTEQMEALRLEGCGELQGYLFSRPRHGLEVADMLRQHDNATLGRDRPAGAVPARILPDIAALAGT